MNSSLFFASQYLHEIAWLSNTSESPINVNQLIVIKYKDENGNTKTYCRWFPNTKKKNDNSNIAVMGS